LQRWHLHRTCLYKRSSCWWRTLQSEQTLFQQAMFTQWYRWGKSLLSLQQGNQWPVYWAATTISLQYRSSVQKWDLYTEFVCRRQAGDWCSVRIISNCHCQSKICILGTCRSTLNQ
jgi:hypothetical protein